MMQMSRKIVRLYMGIKMEIQEWISYIMAVVTGAITVVIFAFKNFASKEDIIEIDHRINKMESKIDKNEEKIDRKLEMINDKLDRVLFNSKI
jgi:cell division protein FtsL